LKKLFFKKTSSLLLLIYSFFKEDKIVRKFKDESDIKKFSINIKHPGYHFLKASNYHDHGKFSESYELLKNFDEIKKNWNKFKNENEIRKNDILSPCRAIGSLGNYRTVFNYLYNRINILKIANKPKIYIKKYDKINNKFLLSLFKPFLNFNNNSYLYYKNINKIFYFKAPIEIALPYKKKYYPWAIAENLINQHRLKHKNIKFNFFKLNRQQLLKGKKILHENNLGNYKWYVSLHIREDKKAFYHNTRNANPKNYLKMINEITSRGGAVIRMGDKSMTPLPKINGLIDYPFSNFKSEFMDVFFAATSKFVVGTPSGFWTIARFFNTPLLLTNFIPHLDYYSFDKNCIFLPKLLINKQKKIISIKDIYSKNYFSHFTTTKQFKKNSLKIIENNNEELQGAVVDMFNLISKNKKNKNIFLKKNNNFKQKYLRNKMYDSHKLLPIANFSSSYIKNYI
jgi:putative glycosyltransferase (TIGR04372 family)